MTRKLKFKIVCGENVQVYFPTMEAAQEGLAAWQDRFPSKRLVIEEILPIKAIKSKK